MLLNEFVKIALEKQERTGAAAVLNVGNLPPCPLPQHEDAHVEILRRFLDVQQRQRRVVGGALGRVTRWGGMFSFRQSWLAPLFPNFPRWVCG